MVEVVAEVNAALVELTGRDVNPEDLDRLSTIAALIADGVSVEQFLRDSDGI